jgi:antitoxin PrlF
LDSGDSPVEDAMLESKLTERSQTTVPNGVRKALQARPGIDHLSWEIRGDVAIVRRAPAMDEEEDDPALEPFLRLLASDIEAHPERLRGIPEDLYRRWVAVTEGVPVDLDETLEGPVAL